jgi:hypothetical protein
MSAAEPQAARRLFGLPICVAVALDMNDPDRQHFRPSVQTDNLVADLRRIW